MEVVRHSSFQVLPKLAAACCYLSTMGEWSRTRVQLYTRATLGSECCWTAVLAQNIQGERGEGDVILKSYVQDA